MSYAILQAGAGWHFDPRSALIGALIAWLIAFLLYRRREALQEKLRQLLAPITAMRQRWQSSAEEKYAAALRRTLRTRLLGRPRELEAIVRPPRFCTEGDLPSTLLDAERPIPTMHLTAEGLLRGYPRLLLTGSEGMGRTTALIALAMQALEKAGDFPFPLWLELEHLTHSQEERETPIEWLATLGAKSIPHAQERLLAAKLAEEPVLLLVDGWDKLSEDIRPWVAARLAEAAEALPTTRWIVATSPRGCGWLTERGFVPLTLQPPDEQEALALYEGWASLAKRPPAADFEELLRWAVASGDGYLPLTLRILLHLQHGEAPDRFADLLRAWREHLLPTAGDEEEAATMEEASRLAAKLLQQLAYRLRVEGLPLDGSIFREVMEALLPPEEARPPHLAERVKRQLDASRLLVKRGRQLHFRHFAWADLFAALSLVERQEVLPLLHHLDDPAWNFLIECSVALGGGEELVRHLLRRAVRAQEVEALLRVARWAILAPDEVRWRKPVLMALAQAFTRKGMDFSTRLEVGKALALVAGEEARPFYLKALRHPDLEVRAASLRGLGWTGTPREMQILTAAVDDTHDIIREAAVRALGDLGTGGALRLLRDLLYRGDETLLLTVAETLATLPAGWEVLKEAAEDTDLLVRRAAAHGLGRVPKPWAEALLTKMAREDGEWLVRSAADAALSARTKRGEEGAKVPAPPQVDALPWLIHWAAQHGLGVGVGEAAYAALLHALEHGEPEAQILAARTLLRIGREKDVESLRQALRGTEDARVRQVLEAVLREMEGRYVIATPYDYGSSEAK